MTITPAETSASQQTHHSRWIDLLRGVSALAIVLFHVRVDLWVGWQNIRANPADYNAFDRACSWLSVATPFFGSAVMLFFLVSGFCVHLAYANGGRAFEWNSYARRRFFRIYPPYLAIVVLALLGERLAALYGGEVSGTSTMLKTLAMVQNYGANAGQIVSNPSLWSLPVEVELYLAYPLFLGGCLRFGIGKTMLAVTFCSLFIFALTYFSIWQNSLFHPAENFLIYWIIWCGGALLAEGFKRNRLPQWNVIYSVAAILILGLAALATLKEASVELKNLLWSSFYFLLMLWGLTRLNPLRLPVQKWEKPLLFLGSISYSLYLIHFPFFHVCGVLWTRYFGAKPANFLVSLAFVALSIPLAALFYRLVELPSHGWARKFGATRTPRSPVAQGAPPK